VYSGDELFRTDLDDVDLSFIYWYSCVTSPKSQQFHCLCPANTDEYVMFFSVNAKNRFLVTYSASLSARVLNSDCSGERTKCADVCGRILLLVSR
jgi:hypothetical protein